MISPCSISMLNKDFTTNEDDLMELGLSSFKLAELDPTHLNKSCLCFDSRATRNILRVSLAGGLSTAGACLAGLMPDIYGILAGGALSGIGNAASTWLAWEKKREHLLKERLVVNFSVLKNIVEGQVSKVEVLASKVNAVILNNKLATVGIELTNNVSDVATAKESVSPDSNMPFFWKTRNRRNTVRLLVAGGLSAAGGWLSGFDPSLEGVVAGGVLGGIGNAVSTWLAYEQLNDEVIRLTALENLPNLVDQTKKNEGELYNVIRQIAETYPSIIEGLTSELKSIKKEQLAIESEELSNPSCCSIRSRAKRNFVYVNTAGWLSAAGGWVGGFFPSTPGILAGGTMGAVANSVSTWLAWEKSHEQAMDRVAQKQFPELQLKINELAQKIHQLKSIIKSSNN